MPFPIRSSTEPPTRIISQDFEEASSSRPQRDQLMSPEDGQPSWWERKILGFSNWIWLLFRGFSCRGDIPSIEEREISGSFSHELPTREEKVRIIKSNLDLFYIWEPDFPEEYDSDDLIEEEENPNCGLRTYGEIWDAQQETWDCIAKLLSNALRRVVDKVYLHPEWGIDEIEAFGNAQIEFLDPLFDRCQYDLQMDRVFGELENTMIAIGSLNNRQDEIAPREHSNIDLAHQDQSNIFMRVRLWLFRLFFREERDQGMRSFLNPVQSAEEEGPEVLSGFTRRLLDWEPAFPENLDRNALISIAGHPHKGKTYQQAWELKRDDWELIIKLFVIELNKMQDAFREDRLETVSFNYLFALMNFFKDDLQYPLVKRKLFNAAETMLQLIENLNPHIHP